MTRSFPLIHFPLATADSIRRMSISALFLTPYTRGQFLSRAHRVRGEELSLTTWNFATSRKRAGKTRLASRIERGSAEPFPILLRVETDLLQKKSP